MTGLDDLARLRAVADAVLYEGYLLYPYRSTSRKNHSRWQFGVLGPDGAADRDVGEDPAMRVECLLDRDEGVVEPVLRFLQLQVRTAEAARTDGRGYEAVPELAAAGRTWVSWDEAVAVEVPLGAFGVTELLDTVGRDVRVPGGVDVEDLGPSGRLVRTRFPLRGRVELSASRVDDAVRLRVDVRNETDLDGVASPGTPPKDTAIRHSLIGAHLLLGARDARFVSLLEPPDRFAAAAAGCRQHRCYPVLAGDQGAAGTSDVVLASPIILYDHPRTAEESGGDLFDATEIDEILTLRVMTLTDEEKAQARATDPLAAQIIDRCDTMSPADMQRLHGALRDPRAVETGMPVPPTFTTPGGLVPELPDDVPWWDPAADTSVRPEADGVLVDGVRIAKGSLVRLRPSRRADAQDLFLAGKVARVATVHADVDGRTHVGVVVLDDPAAELHDWYGRYLYFAPDEVEPLDSQSDPANEREENRS
ncbi:hypothetical protein [Rhodococcus sp. ACT016]|uniref:hypothetical protein n=1 Tax=Rhodococcus sp. ACT016 TaxID=3134808 RepID=UPI003D2E80E0